jgi:hypothetical protein
MLHQRGAGCGEFFVAQSPLKGVQTGDSAPDRCGQFAHFLCRESRGPKGRGDLIVGELGQHVADPGRVLPRDVLDELTIRPYSRA